MHKIHYLFSEILIHPLDIFTEMEYRDLFPHDEIISQDRSLISRKINGIMVQIFSALIAHLLLLIIQSSVAVPLGIPQMIRKIRHVMPLPQKQASGMAASSPGI